jgi:rhodanese-related sulfurtransferase
MNLNLLLQFVSEQWILFAALSVVIAMFIRHELSRGAPGLTPQQSIRRVNSDGGIFLDIREVGDFKQGHIADALHIPSAKLATRMGELESYKEKPIIVVCRMGQTAGGASKQLLDAGFSEVFKMKGGMMEWDALQLPVVSVK